MQKWDQHIETLLSGLRSVEVPFGIGQRIIERLAMKHVRN
jgi:hypothetical protein